MDKELERALRDGVRPEMDLTPDDELNRTLLANVRPADWTNPDPRPRYNLVVIGAGTAGLVAAAGAAGLGATVALVERRLMGGDCLNAGCVPSKTLIRSARAAHDVRDAARFGVEIPGPPEARFAQVMERIRSVRAGISAHDSARRFTEEYGVDVFLGQACFSGRDVVNVGQTSLRFERALLATGARPSVPSVPGLVEAGFLTNETIFNLTELPARLAVIGGGPIGCELSQAFARLGSLVTIIELNERFLAREDLEAAALLREALIADGVAVRLGTRLERVEKTDTGRRLRTAGPEGEGEVEVDEILVGVGRTPNVEGLGLESAGITFGPGGVAVNRFLRTTNRRVYAAGDVCLSHQFTHTADAAARAALQNAFFPFAGRKRIDRLTIPWCTYTDPEVAHTGLNPQSAAERGVRLDTFVVSLSDVDRAVTEGEATGFLKVHTRKGTGRIVGATMVARHAGEIISELTLAIEAGVGLGELAGVIHPYPTQAEAVRKAADAYNRTRLTPRATRILRRYFAWRR